MPEYKELLNLKSVADTDTGMYEIGEIDGGFNDLRGFLKSNGIKGRDDLILTLCKLQAKVLTNFEEINYDDNDLLNRGYDKIL